MSERTRDEKLLDRRGFLKGSALFAAAAGLAAAMPAAAQEQAPQAPQPPAEQGTAEEPKKDEQPKKKVLRDDKGREYRVCDMCGGNMYKGGKTWTCEQCGFSYEE
jgi:anaerobic selenocysteine-containing dehydrogenase